jgi:hypothetical protein
VNTLSANEIADAINHLVSVLFSICGLISAKMLSLFIFCFSSCAPAFHFRGGHTDMPQRTRLLHLISQQLAALANSEGLAVVLTNQMTTKVCAAHIPILSYRYTVAMFPLPYKNVLKYRTRPNVGGISILVFNQECTRECPRILPRAVLRIGLYRNGQLTLRGKEEKRGHALC